MLKRIKDDLGFSISLFRLKKRELIFWILIRLFTSAINPLMLPVIVKVMIDSIEKGVMRDIVFNSVLLIIGVIVCFSISYYIYVYSDAWVMKSMYSYQKTCIEKVSNIVTEERRSNYSDADVAYTVNNSSWGLIQIWLQIFRLFAPLIATILLTVFEISISIMLFGLSLISVIFDCVIIKIQTKKNLYFQKKIIDIEGEREGLLKEAIDNAAFYEMYDISDKLDKSISDIRDSYWKENTGKEKYNYRFDLLMDIINGVFRFGLWQILAAKSGDFEAGKITSSNTTFDNLRKEAGDLRKQLMGTVDKLVPVEKQSEILKLESVDNTEYQKDNEEELFSIENVTFSYDDKELFSNLKLRMNNKEKIALIGMNGSGKSTLISLICGFVKPENGTVKRALSNTYIDYIPAERNAFSQSLYENVYMGSKSKQDEGIEKYLGYSELQEYQNDEAKKKNAKDLSGGECQRMMIARGLIGEGNLLIMDEPTASLDEKKSKKVMDNIFQRRDSVLYTTHKPNELLYSNRVVLLDGGKIIADLPTPAFMKSQYYENWCGQYKTK